MAGVFVLDGRNTPCLPRSEHPRASGQAAISTVPSTVPGTLWPPYGQAAFVQSGRSQVQAGPNQHAAPIVSVAKVMTAYVVLRDHPLQLGQDGPAITLSRPMSSTSTAGA